MDNLLNFQIARFIGGENAGEELQSDNKGWFVSSIDVGTIQADSGDKYECSPSPGSSAIANVHVITEGQNVHVNLAPELTPSLTYSPWLGLYTQLNNDDSISSYKLSP